MTTTTANRGRRRRPALASPHSRLDPCPQRSRSPLVRVLALATILCSSTSAAISGPPPYYDPNNFALSLPPAPNPPFYNPMGPPPLYPPPPGLHGSPSPTLVPDFLAELKSRSSIDVAVKFVAPVLETVVDTNDRLHEAGLQPEPQQPSIFRVRRPPAVGLREYLERIARISQCQPECLIMALVYLDRVVSREYANSYTIHRLLLAALMIAARHKDTAQTWNYQLYQRISGLGESELKVLESEMLKRLNYNIEVTPQEIYDYGVKALTYKKRIMFRPENP